VLGDDHSRTLRSINNMGALLLSMGKLAEADLYYREALDGRRRVLGDDHPDTLISIHNMGALLQSMGKLAEAEPYSREALEGFRRVLGDDHSRTLRSINNMGALLNAMGRHEEARTLLEQGEPAARRAWTGPNAKWLGNYLAKLGEARTGVGEYTGAESTLLEAHGLLVAGFGEKHKRTLKCIERLTRLYDAWHAAEPGAGHDAQAAAWRAKLPPTPAMQPTSQQTTQPTTQATTQPTTQPSARPSSDPVARTTSHPTEQPKATGSDED
jgi:non-specific serine/threonine protein kinase/serine/threonine-protein kinase